MKQLIIQRPTLCNGTWYYPAPKAQEVGNEDAATLIGSGNAKEFCTKAVDKTEKKSVSASGAAPASDKKTPRKRKPANKKA